jgi:hypothetical protein
MMTIMHFITAYYRPSAAWARSRTLELYMSTGNLRRLCAFSYLTRLHLILVKHIDNVVAVLSSPPGCQLMLSGTMAIKLTGDASISGHMTPSLAGWILTPCTGGREA